MGAQVALLVAALAGCLLRARSCVICDPRVVAALDALEKEYLPTHLAPGRHRQVMERIRETVRDFRDLPYLEDTFMGVIGEGRVESGNPGWRESRGLVLGLLEAGEGRDARVGGRVCWVREWRRLRCRFQAFPWAKEYAVSLVLTLQFCKKTTNKQKTKKKQKTTNPQNKQTKKLHLPEVNGRAIHLQPWPCPVPSWVL